MDLLKISEKDSQLFKSSCQYTAVPTIAHKHHISLSEYLQHIDFPWAQNTKCKQQNFETKIKGHNYQHEEDNDQ